jgi:hypothetical protein
VLLDVCRREERARWDETRTYNVEPEDLDPIILFILRRLFPRIKLLALVCPPISSRPPTPPQRRSPDSQIYSPHLSHLILNGAIRRIVICPLDTPPFFRLAIFDGSKSGGKLVESVWTRCSLFLFPSETVTGNSTHVKRRRKHTISASGNWWLASDARYRKGTDVR